MQKGHRSQAETLRWVAWKHDVEKAVYIIVPSKRLALILRNWPMVHMRHAVSLNEAVVIVPFYGALGVDALPHPWCEVEKYMQTLVEIDFQGMTRTPQLQSSIKEHVAELEKRNGRITACRVVVKAPGGHHRTSGLYEVNIKIALPNEREVNVERTAPADERSADLAFAINEGFKRARRRLQDHARELQGHIKQHEGQPIGTVMRLDPTGDFGFLEATDGHEVLSTETAFGMGPLAISLKARE